jgi:rhodanese-related sulfurtransferase
MTRHFVMPDCIFPLMLGLCLISTSLMAGEPPLTDQQKNETVQKMYIGYKKKFPKIADISADKAMKLAERKQIIFVDARRPDEQAVSMLPDAITRDMLLKDPTLIQGKTAVAYCTIGYRSGVWAEKMAQRGIHIINLAGGILAWVHAGGKVYGTQGETKKIHVFGKSWDLAPKGFDTVVFGFFEQIFNFK